ncbi:Glutamate formiminotransferase [Fusobacterium necrophorum subsp. necrophorum]|nr:Glutamate formiminotransferase [Fusobacterium necrophorum subsp. necrophorum]
MLGVEPDGDYNRTVVTVMGEPEIVAEAVIRSIGIAAEVIDMNVHRGEHKRMGQPMSFPLSRLKI